MAKMHDDELDVAVGVVSRLVAKQFPEYSTLPLFPVSSPGTNNALFRLGADLVVRLPLFEQATGQIDKDFAWLPRLAPYLPVAIPRPVAKGAPSDEYPFQWAVYGWLDGVTPSADAFLDDSASVSLASFVRALHAVDIPDGPEARRGAPLVVQDTGTRAAIDHLSDVYDAEVLTQLWDDALAVPPWDRAPMWVHGDLGPGNVVLDRGRLTAVIDFGGVGVGDPACDMIAAWNLLSPAARSTYRSALGVDESTWRRGRGWALSISLKQLPYYWDSNRFLRDSSIHVINEVIREQFGPHRVPTAFDRVRGR